MESGAKAKTVKKYLGKGWMVDACGGHIDRLPAKKGEKGKNDAMWKSSSDKLPEAPWTSDKSKRDKIKYELKPEAMTTLFKCRKCGSRSCSYYEFQTRSADEPMTQFITCLDCNNNWKQ